MTQASRELQAMISIEAALADLDVDERGRVVQWISSRFPASRGTFSQGASGIASLEQDESDNSAEGFASFYDLAQPEGDAEKALVCAYWLQFRQGAADLDSQAVNTELKHLGHGIGNITRAFEALKTQRPALIVQTRKEGNTQQARKKFKVTNEGKKSVERLMRRDQASVE